MPKKRQPKEIWKVTRRKVWERDSKQCVRCRVPILFKQFHCDHIRPLSRGGTNILENLRVLCPRCHVLRSCNSHRGMIAAALRKGIIPPNWRELVWDD